MKQPIDQAEAFKQQERAGMLPGPAACRRTLEYELRLRDALMRQSQGMQNIAPGSPLYDRVMGAGAYQSAPSQPAQAPKKMKTETITRISIGLFSFTAGIFCVLITLTVTS